MLLQILRGATWSLQETTGGNCIMCSVYYSSALPPQFHLVDHGVFWFCCSGQERQWFFSVESEADWSSRSPAPSLAPDHILYLVATPGFLRCPFSSSWLTLLTLWRALQSEAIVMSPRPLLTAPPPHSFLRLQRPYHPFFIIFLMEKMCAGAHLCVHAHPWLVKACSSPRSCSILLSSSQNCWLTQLISGFSLVLSFTRASLD